MEGAEAEAAESCQQQVNAEDLGQVERVLRYGVLPDLEIPVGPVPDRCQHQQAGKNDVSGSNALEAPSRGRHRFHR